MTTIDWATMMANSQKIGEPIPEGDYPAVCEDASFGQSKAGEPQWRITWKIVGGAHNNRRVLDQQTLAQAPDEKGAQRRGFFFRNMKSLGMDDGFFAQMPPGEMVAQRIVGLQAMLTLIINQNGYNNVRGYQLVGGAVAQQPQQMQQAQAQPGFQQPMQPQQGFPQQGGFQPAAAQPQPQPGQYQQQFGQPQPGFPEQQGGFQQPQQAQPMQQPQQGGYGQQFQQPQGPMPPQGFQRPQEPQNVTQTPGYQQAGGPQPQQPQDPNQPQQNGQQQPFTPQPQAPF